MLVGTVETLHGWWTLETQELMVSNLSLKLYHGGKLRWGYQHLMTEAPVNDPNCNTRSPEFFHHPP